MTATTIATIAILMAAGTAAAPPLGALTTVSYPLSVRLDGPIATHDRDFRFLQGVMLRDQLWRPILSLRVRMAARPGAPTDHFATPPDAGAVADTVVVDPFRETVLLMASNSTTGTAVRLAAAAVRGAMVCSALQHVSLQAFLVHHLIARDDAVSDVAPIVTPWLERMLRVAIDKLVAAEQPVPLIARLHFHVRQLMVPTADLKANRLRDIGREMLDEMGRVCEMTDKRGPYASLIKAFKSPTTTERLDALDEALSLDENMKDVVDLHTIKEIRQLNGTLGADETLDADGLGSMDVDDLKKMLTINRVEMNFLWANLPVKALADAQWAHLFNVKPSKAEE